MFRIGDFAKMARVSIKTLHHYDEIGLLKPEHVDSSTGYRYYSIDQLPRLNRILALKDLGFTLNQIRAMLNQHLSPLELRGMLRMKEVALEQMIQEEQERLEQVRVRLKAIEREDLWQNYDILIKPVENQTIASARKCLPLTDDTFRQCSELADAVHARILQAGGKPTGYWFSIYHEMSIESHNERIDIEIATRVEPSLLTKLVPDETGEVIVRELPGTPTMAYLLYQGSYDGLWNAYIALMVWIETHGYQSAGPSRYIYLRMLQGEEPLTEIQIPIEQTFHQKTGRK